MGHCERGVTVNPEFSKNSGEKHTLFGILITPVFLIRFFRPYKSTTTLWPLFHKYVCQHWDVPCWNWCRNGMVPVWVFRNQTRFWNWASSFKTGRPVSKLLESQNYIEPSSGTGSSSSSTGCPILARCRFGNVGVPVPELDDPELERCQNGV